MKTLFVLTFMIGLGWSAVAGPVATLFPADSIGIKKINNRNYIIHKVDPQETLSALSRRYGVSVEAIMNANNGLTENLIVGQVIYVPYLQKKLNAGTEKRIYVVKTGETLYAISKRFNLSIDKLKELNNMAGSDIQQGQELVVLVPKPQQALAGPTLNTPTTATETAATDQASFNTPAAETKTFDPYKQAAVEPEAAGGSAGENIQVVADNQKVPKIHTVKPKEFLYTLSQKLKVEMDSLREWNNLQGNELKAGEALIVGFNYYKGKELVKSVGATTDYELAYQPGEGNAMENQYKAAQSGELGMQAAEVPSKSGFQVTGSEDGVPVNRKISGVGAMIKSRSGSGSSQYVALHPNAEYGTYVKVTNPSNGLSTVVKIIGKIPPGQNKNVLIMLSEAACRQIGVLNKEFPIQISYND